MLGSENKRTNIVLVGMMGSGKSTVATIVAEMISFEAVDLDGDIEKEMGETIVELFADQPEQAFRATESRLLATRLLVDGVVIATGGGIVLADQNRGLIEKHYSVYLAAEVPTLTRRVADAASRPLLGPTQSLPAQIEALMEQRQSLYSDCATITIPTDSLTPQEVALEIVSRYREDMR